MRDTIICGDALDVMRGMDDGCVDAIVTDPPYGMSFMGKAWDKALPSVDVWCECLRVLKPGAFAFVMCIPRQDCLSRMIINLEDAGFMVNFSPIYHTFATGFPKAANLSKLADKRAGAEREVLGRNPHQQGRRTNNTGQHGGYIGDTEVLPEDRESFITAPRLPKQKPLTVRMLAISRSRQLKW